MGVQTNKKYMFKIWNFSSFHYKNSCGDIWKIHQILPRFYHISKYALIWFLSFSEVEIYHFPSTLYIAYIWQPLWILRGWVTPKSHKNTFKKKSSMMYNIKCLQSLLLFFMFEPPYPTLNNDNRCCLSHPTCSRLSCETKYWNICESLTRKCYHYCWYYIFIVVVVIVVGYHYPWCHHP